MAAHYTATHADIASVAGCDGAAGVLYCAPANRRFRFISPETHPMSSKDKTEPLYRVVFQQQGEVYEIYARYLYQSDLYGFIELEQLVFGERSALVLDPGEEKLKSTFQGVRRTFIPLPAVIRIDEVDSEGPPRITDALEPELKSNVTHFPTHFFPPRDDR